MRDKHFLTVTLATVEKYVGYYECKLELRICSDHWHTDQKLDRQWPELVGQGWRRHAQ